MAEWISLNPAEVHVEEDSHRTGQTNRASQSLEAPLFGQNERVYRLSVEHLESRTRPCFGRIACAELAPTAMQVQAPETRVAACDWPAAAFDSDP